MNLKIIIALVLILLLGVIIVQNTQVVTLKLLFWEITLSRIILIALTLLIGFVIGYIVAKMSDTRTKNIK